MSAFTLAEVQERTYKKRDAWWTVFLVDPLAGRLVVWTANHTSITPNQLTFGAGVLGLASALCFTQGSWPWLVAGALLFHLSFVLDCMDGKIARLKGTGSVFGAWVDFVFDRIRFFVCMMALLLGQWVHTGELVYLLMTPMLTFFDLLRYLNGPQVAKTRRAMRRQLAEAIAGLQSESLVEDAESTETEENNGAPRAETEPPTPVPTVPSRFTQFRAYQRVGEALLRHRVRPHLFSGIEFEMFVCVVAPLTAVVSLFTPWPSLIVPVAVFASAALLLFEAVLVVKLWLDTRSFEAEKRRLTATG
ncbi:CDP-alcohol phosphatidyltransferase family protein [Thermobifida cellulosilytica]|uniref:CDP-alcohol phosphatidyltransferase n=1 Tax=Thermobifida cellulosilytica TB100 TaxID=665004 RepID=A0A147KER5_THECS|nr:CDP-alcohol phosphatidyltransferase family protein [Thermobifida cellulosilytica]KUP95729.1 CDP-alcohol phosphatidyltransferase [Thermobifida cellulosilytica TB100]